MNVSVRRIRIMYGLMPGLKKTQNVARTKPVTLSSAEPLQKSPVVRPKDSAYPVNLKESVEEQQATIQEELPLKDQTVYSYQQISCLDSVIRYDVIQRIKNSVLNFCI